MPALNNDPKDAAADSGPATSGADTEPRVVKLFISGYGVRTTLLFQIALVVLTLLQPWGPNTFNPSYPIVALLPRSFPLPSNPALTIQLVGPQYALPVNYPQIAALDWDLLNESKPDLVLHVGLATGRKYYGPEQSAARPTAKDGAAVKDTWDQNLRKGLPSLAQSNVLAGNGHSGDDAEEPAAAPLSQLTGWPVVFENTFNYPALISRWQALCGARGVEEGYTRKSDDVGFFLCGFISYLTHAWWWYNRQGEGGAQLNGLPVSNGNGEAAAEMADTPAPGRARGGPSLFLHVPVCETDEDLQRGATIAQALVESMVEDWLGGSAQ